VLSALLDRLVLMVNLELRGSLESLVRRVMQGPQDLRAWLEPTALRDQ